VAKKLSPKQEAIPCSLLPEVQEKIVKYSHELKDAAYKIGSHGLNKEDFDASGIFQASIERLRGIQAASTATKRNFIIEILNHLKLAGKIKSFNFTGQSDRHDYQVIMPDDRLVIFEAKGCLDGNNTNIFQRPPNADEFFIWSLCQNPGADPKHNAWSGIHTRLGVTVMADKQRVDGLVIWDMICGTAGRPCPKLIADPKRATELEGGRLVPPPCIYLFPRTIPDPRNNPNPHVWDLKSLSFLNVLADVFHCNAGDITAVHIEAQMSGADVQRKTTLKRNGIAVAESGWTDLKRAAR